MKTLITLGHTRDIVWRHITQEQATTVCTVLRAVAHIPLTAEVGFDGSVYLRPQRALSTAERVTVIRAMCAVSDSPLVWAGTVSP